MFLKTKNNEIWKTLIGFINLRVTGDFGERCFGGAIRAKTRLERMGRKEIERSPQEFSCMRKKERMVVAGGVCGIKGIFAKMG